MTLTIVYGAVPNGIINVGLSPYNAVPDEVYFDGVANSTTTLTSATANFTNADVGKQIVVQRGGPSTYQDNHTTIASVTNSTTVILANACQRSQTGCKLYISRGGDQTSILQSAINAASAAGGATVMALGAGYLVTGLVMKNRVTLVGSGMRGTMIHLANAANRPVIRNDYTSDNAATVTTIRDIHIDGNRVRQADVSTTLGLAYTAGNNTITLTTGGGALMLPIGVVKIASNYLTYSSVTGDVLGGVVGGLQGSTDANALNGATITQSAAHAVYHAQIPPFSNPLNADSFDAHHLLQNVYLKNTKGCGYQAWGGSGSKVDNCWGSYTDEPAFMPSFDTVITNCQSDTTGRMGFYFYGSSICATGNKAFYAGGNVPADGHGFLLEGPTLLEEGTKTLTACCAQDNKAHGFYLRNAQRVALQCAASSNSTSGSGNYVGVMVEGSTCGIIDVVSVERFSPGTQMNGMQIVNTALTSGAMKIRMTHAAANGTTVGTPLKSGSSLTGGIDISINGQGSTVTDAFNAAPTPDPYVATSHIMVLTNNIVVGVPANAHLGCPLTMILQQDGTGGRTIGWNAIFKNTPTSVTTASAYTIGRFVYDGTNWVGV